MVIGEWRIIKRKMSPPIPAHRFGSGEGPYLSRLHFVKGEKELSFLTRRIKETSQSPAIEENDSRFFETFLGRLYGLGAVNFVPSNLWGKTISINFGAAPTEEYICFGGALCVEWFLTASVEDFYGKGIANLKMGTREKEQEIREVYLKRLDTLRKQVCATLV